MIRQLTGVLQADYANLVMYYNLVLLYCEKISNFQDYTTTNLIQIFKNYEECAIDYNSFAKVFSQKYPTIPFEPNSFDLFKGDPGESKRSLYILWFE